MSGTVNPFDQLDAPSAAPQAPAVNPFDQFDGHPMAGPSGSFLTDVGRRLGTAGADTLAGLLSFPRTVASAVDFVGRHTVGDPGLSPALGSVQTPNGDPLFPDYATAREGAFQTTGGTEYVPQTMAGRVIQDALPGAAMGLGGGIRAVLPSAVGRAAASAVGQIAPSWGPVAQMAAFVAGGRAAATGLNAVSRTAAAATGMGTTTPLFQAYQRQGVPTDLAGDVTQNPSIMLAQSRAAKLPGGSDAVHAAVQAARDGWQSAIERNAALLGPAATPQEAGQSLQSAAQNWLQDWKSQSNQKWNDFSVLVPPSSPIRVDNFQNTLNGVLQNFGGADNLAKVLQPGLASTLQQALGADLQGGSTLPWQSVQSVRSRLGEMLESNQPVADMTQSAIKRLYGALSDDMRAGASQAGPSAARAFNAANAYTAFGHDLIDNHIAPILNAPNPETAAQYALSQARQGASRLNAIGFAMPDQPANLGATLLRQAGNTANPGEAVPGQLLTTLKKLSPEAQATLFGAAQPGVNDLADIATAMRNTVRETGNNSNTAAHAATGIGRFVMAHEMGGTGYAMGGAPGAAIGATLGYFAPTLMGQAARMTAVNPGLSRIYSTQAAPFRALPTGLPLAPQMSLIIGKSEQQGDQQ